MTRFFYSLCLVFFTSTISFTLWATTLSVSENLVVIEVDNKVVEHGLLSKKSTFTLNKGKHALIVFYKDVFEDLDFAEDRVVKSKNFVVKFNVTNEKQLKLSTIAIQNLAQAEAFSKSPELIIKDERKKQIGIELDNVSDYKIAQQVDIAVSTFASKQPIKKDKEPTLAKMDPISEQISATDIKRQSSNTLPQVKSLTMLKYWWINASDQEKKHFKQYITVQNNHNQ